MPRTGTQRGLATLTALFALAGCGTSSSTATSSLTGSTIVVGIVDDAPGLAFGDRNPAGFDIDLMNAVREKLGTPVAPTILTAADRAGYLKSKKATLVISSYSITARRNKEGIDFAGPYMVSPQALLVRARGPRIAAKSDLKGKSVCTAKTTTGSTVPIPGADMSTHPATTRDCVDLLTSGRTDAVFTDALILYGYTHAYPGQFKVIFSGVFGELQYYGIGLLGNRHADCLKLNDVISDYLRTQWRHDFLDTLQDAAAAYRASDASAGDFESQFKPKDSDMANLSCKL